MDAIVESQGTHDEGDLAYGDAYSKVYYPFYSVLDRDGNDRAEKASDSYTVVFIGDSFYASTSAMQELFTNTFGKVVYANIDQATEHLRSIIELNPDIIIVETVERAMELRFIGIMSRWEDVLHGI